MTDRRVALEDLLTPKLDSLIEKYGEEATYGTLLALLKAQKDQLDKLTFVGDKLKTDAINSGGDVVANLMTPERNYLSAFDELLVAEETVLFGKGFYDGIMGRDWSFKIVSTTASRDLHQGCLRLQSGTAKGEIECLGRKHIHYVSGKGLKLKFSVLLSGFGNEGNKREWGWFHHSDGLYFRYVDGILSFVRRSGGTEYLIASTDWDIPLDFEAIRDKINLFYIQLPWLGAGDMYIWHNKRLVHTLKWAGLQDNVTIQRPNQHFMVRNENLNVTTTNYILKIGCMSGVVEGKWETDNKEYYLYGNSVFRTLTTSYIPILVLKSMDNKAGVHNHKKVHIRKLFVSTDALNVQVAIAKNISGLNGTFDWVERAENPLTYPTVSITSNDATNSGYGNNQNLYYKYSVIGTSGETLPSPASTVVNSGTPAKQISVAIEPVTGAVSYAIYRSLNGTDYYRIAEVPTEERNFVDNAYAATSTIPATSNNTEGDSCIMYNETATTYSGGKVLFPFYPPQNEKDITEINIELYEGENIAVLATKNAAHISCGFEWTEE